MSSGIPFVSAELLNHVISTEAARLVGASERPQPAEESWAVDGAGRKLTYEDGSIIDGARIVDLVERSGQQLTNSQAAELIRRGDRFVDSIWSCLQVLRARDSA